MKKWIPIVLLGWMALVDTTKWDDVSFPEEGKQAVHVSNRTQKPKLRDILWGPRAPSWREVRGKTLGLKKQFPVSRAECREGTVSARC